MGLLFWRTGKPRRVRCIDEKELGDTLDVSSRGSESVVVELVVDSINGKVYHVRPKTGGHIKAVADILGINEEAVSDRILGISRFVSALIEIKENVITSAMIGYASLESSGKVHHEMWQLKSAENIILKLIDHSVSRNHLLIKSRNLSLYLSKNCIKDAA